VDATAHDHPFQILINEFNREVVTPGNTLWYYDHVA